MWKYLTYGNWNASVFAASFERKSVVVFEPISSLAKFSNRLYSELNCFPSSFGWKSVAIFGLFFAEVVEVQGLGERDNDIRSDLEVRLK